MSAAKNGKPCEADGCRNVNTVGYGLCQGHYTQRRRGHPITPLDNRHKNGLISDPVSYIHAKVAIDTSSGCWNWPGSNKYGYSSGLRARLGANTDLVHRLSWMTFNGPIPVGLAVHHRCGNTRCCNPDHLQLSTNHENTAEMVVRRALLTRISVLEQALAEIDPDHPVLGGAL